jgi:hypothetical protein
MLALFAAIVSLLIAAVPAAATGSSGPAYRADIAPGTAPAGKTSELVITITQLSDSSSKKVKTVKVSAPGDLAISGASAKDKNGSSLAVSSSASDATVTNIPYPGKDKVAAVIKLDVAIPCGIGGSRSWTVIAKNSSNSVLSQDAASQLTTSIDKCRLEFATQPADAGRDKVITSVVADPDGEKVKVQLLNGNGGQASQSGVTISLAIVGGGALGGTTSVATNSNGVATFAPTIGTTADDYRLEATASGIIGTESGTFDISDVAVVCEGECSGTSSKGGTTTTIAANSSGGVLSFSLGTSSVDCNNKTNLWYKGTSAPVEFDVTSGTGRTTVTIELDRADVTKPFLLYEVCFSSPESRFRNLFGKWIEPGEAGLLPPCLFTIRRSDQPCLVAKWIDKDRDVHVRFSVPPGDPRGRI